MGVIQLFTILICAIIPHLVAMKGHVLRELAESPTENNRDEISICCRGLFLYSTVHTSVQYIRQQETIQSTQNLMMVIAIAEIVGYHGLSAEA
ncbi:hypothetical protein B9Z19DRAFT_454282 [Tuber borchii]|uniref:Uncharacterized protein n=1 Tax=Tuber borchii TaxID=42251 RepID=A0A2T6ZFW0_TUBBO|nr:hypothetical protein B9Z19DRAFT_454282 [Tuber borchii]